MDQIGRYKIVRELGRGAMGVVYHAVDPNIGRPVAIKTIQLGGRKPEERERLRERLFREARSAGILSHPGIVTIYDVEQQGELAYIAMEYVAGVTLDQLLEPDRPIAPDRLFAVLWQTAAALDYAHQKGIVHRDIKPANIMIATDGTAKVTDFGIAKITASDQFTMTGSIVGTPHYMSPEQVQGQAVDGRSDQFSLAVIAFEALTGEKPFTGEHLHTVVYKIVAEEPLSPARVNPTLGPAIEAVLRRGLSKKPEGRHGNCQEFVSSLEKACAATRGWRAMARGGAANEATLVERARPASVSLPPVRPTRAGEAAAADSTASKDEAPPKRRTALWPFLLAILTAAGLLALIGWQADPDFPEYWKGLAGKAQAALGMGAAQPLTPAPVQPTPVPAAQPQGLPDDPKPSPLVPLSAEPTPTPTPTPEPEPAAPEDAPTRAPKRAAALQPVSISSDPAGATARVDGKPDASCSTPCVLQLPPGRHQLTVSMKDRENAYTDFTVMNSAVELPPVVLRVSTGSLMLTTVPDGAVVLVNGKRQQKTTPAQITLAPGNYSITVEKNGKQASSSVEIRNGAISYLRIVLEP